MSLTRLLSSARLLLNHSGSPHRPGLLAEASPGSLLSRRGFLGLLGGTAAVAALAPQVPFNRVWSFPSKIVVAQPCSVRFVRAWDPYTAMYINRFDILYGFGTLHPEVAIKNTDNCEVITVPRESEVEGAIVEMQRRIPVLRDMPTHLLAKDGNCPQIRGIDISSDGRFEGSGFIKGNTAKRLLES